VKGDRVEVVIDTGNGTQTFEIEATKAGRRVDISVSRGVVEVSEVTRGGSTVRTGRFMASRIIAMVEHPAGEPEFGAATEDGVARRTRIGRRTGDGGAEIEPLGL
jgi:hypothetical protein